jgi:PhnB protein
MKIEPYLVFEGRCEEAVEFYKKALGAEVTMLMRMKDNPEPDAQGPRLRSEWRQRREGDARRVEDRRQHRDVQRRHDARSAGIQGFALSITVPDEATANKFYNALADGGQPFMPLAKTFWSPYFGMVNDRFGVCWMVGMNPQ